MPIQDIVDNAVREKIGKSRRSSMEVPGGGFVMNQGFSSRISANPMKGGTDSTGKPGAAVMSNNGIHNTFVD